MLFFYLYAMWYHSKVKDEMCTDYVNVFWTAYFVPWEFKPVTILPCSGTLILPIVITYKMYQDI